MHPNAKLLKSQATKSFDVKIGFGGKEGFDQPKCVGLPRSFPIGNEDAPGRRNQSCPL
jgi:hypothetical protein